MKFTLRLSQLGSFYKEHGRLPRSVSKTHLECSLRVSLSGMRNARVGKGSCVWREEYIELAISYGLPADLFDDTKLRSAKKVLVDLKAFVDKYDKLPLSADNKSLYSWLSRCRKKFADDVLDSSIIDFALSIGLPEFIFNKPVDKSNNRIDLRFTRKLNQLSNFYKENGRLPKSTGSTLEIALYRSLHSMRKARVSKGSCRWDVRYIDMAILYGLPANLFDENKKKEKVRKTKESRFSKNKKALIAIKAFVDKHDRLPFYSENNSLCHWIYSVRKRRTKNPRVVSFALSIGLSESIFDKPVSKNDDYAMIDSISVYFKKYFCYPRVSSDDIVERRLSRFISSKRGMLNANSLINYAISVGLPVDIFDRQDKTYREQLDIVNKFYVNCGRFPRKSENGGYWLDGVRSAKVGGGCYVWSDDIADYALGLGLPIDMFDRERRKIKV